MNANSDFNAKLGETLAKLGIYVHDKNYLGLKATERRADYYLHSVCVSVSVHVCV